MTMTMLLHQARVRLLSQSSPFYMLAPSLPHSFSPFLPYPSPPPLAPPRTTSGTQAGAQWLTVCPLESKCLGVNSALRHLSHEIMECI